MNISKVIMALQRFEIVNPNMEVGICLEVSEKGVLANNNFLFHNVEDVALVLISPETFHYAEQLYELKKLKEGETK